MKYGWRVPFTEMVIYECYVLPIVLATALFCITWVVTDRNDVVTYGKLSLDPPVVKPAQVANLVIDVSWRQPDCRITTQMMAWSLGGKSSFPIEGPHISEKPTALILIGKPRPIHMPALSPGEYEIGFEYVNGECWPWEKYLPIRNSVPARAKFRVE